MGDWIAVTDAVDQEEVPPSANIITQEAKEAARANIYQQAIKLHNSGDRTQLQEACRLYKEVIGGAIAKVDRIHQNLSLESRLVYLCLRHLAAAEVSLGLTGEALHHYLQASEIDDTDVTMWYDFAKAAEVERRYSLCRYALEQAISLVPNHKPSLSKLCDVLLKLKDWKAWRRVAQYLGSFYNGGKRPRDLEKLLDQSEKRCRLSGRSTPILHRSKDEATVSPTASQGTGSVLLIPQPTWDAIGSVLLEHATQSPENEVLLRMLEVPLATDDVEEEKEDASIKETEHGKESPRRKFEEEDSVRTKDSEPKSAPKVNRPRMPTPSSSTRSQKSTVPTDQRRVSRRMQEKLKADHEAQLALKKETDIRYQLQFALLDGIQVDERFGEDFDWQPLMDEVDVTQFEHIPNMQNVAPKEPSLFRRDYKEEKNLSLKFVKTEGYSLKAWIARYLAWTARIITRLKLSDDSPIIISKLFDCRGLDTPLEPEVWLMIAELSFDLYESNAWDQRALARCDTGLQGFLGAISRGNLGSDTDAPLIVRYWWLRARMEILLREISSSEESLRLCQDELTKLLACQRTSRTISPCKESGKGKLCEVGQSSSDAAKSSLCVLSMNGDEEQQQRPIGESHDVDSMSLRLPNCSKDTVIHPATIESKISELLRSFSIKKIREKYRLLEGKETVSDDSSSKQVAQDILSEIKKTLSSTNRLTLYRDVLEAIVSKLKDTGGGEQRSVVDIVIDCFYRAAEAVSGVSFLCDVLEITAIDIDRPEAYIIRELFDDQYWAEDSVTSSNPSEPEKEVIERECQEEWEAASGKIGPKYKALAKKKDYFSKQLRKLPPSYRQAETLAAILSHILGFVAKVLTVDRSQVKELSSLLLSGRMRSLLWRCGYIATVLGHNECYCNVMRLLLLLRLRSEAHQYLLRTILCFPVKVVALNSQPQRMPILTSATKHLALLLQQSRARANGNQIPMLQEGERSSLVGKLIGFIKAADSTDLASTQSIRLPSAILLGVILSYLDLGMDKTLQTLKLLHDHIGGKYHSCMKKLTFSGKGSSSNDWDLVTWCVSRREDGSEYDLGGFFPIAHASKKHTATDNSAAPGLTLLSVLLPQLKQPNVRADEIEGEVLRQEQKNEQLAQCYYCSYHVEVTSALPPADHKTEPLHGLTKEEASDLFLFALPYLSTQQGLNRAKVRALLELVYGAMAATPVFGRHRDLALKFLDQPVGPGSLDPCRWHNLAQAEEPMETDEHDQRRTVHGALYFLYANAIPAPKLKVPNKVKQDSGDGNSNLIYEKEYHAIIDLYVKDLTFNPLRLESWSNLGICFRNLLNFLLDTFPSPLKPVEAGEDLLLNGLARRGLFFLHNDERENAGEPGIGQHSGEGIELNVKDEVKRGTLYIMAYRDAAVRSYKVVADLSERKLRTLHSADPAYKMTMLEYINALEEEAVILYNQVQNSEDRESREVLALCHRVEDLARKAVATDHKFDSRTWAMHLLAGKAHEKLSSSPSIVLDHYAQGLAIAQSEAIHSMHPIYRLHSYRMKCLFRIIQTGMIDNEALDLARLHRFEIPAEDSDIVKITPTESELPHLPGSWAEVSDLLFNCMDAMKYILDLDQYYHRARYCLARAVQHYSYAQNIGGLMESESEEEKKAINGAEEALRVMLPLLDKRRPQIVGIWIQDSTTSAMEALDQRRRKYDRLRDKYLVYYMSLLVETANYERCLTIFSWIAALRDQEYPVVRTMTSTALNSRLKILEEMLEDGRMGGDWQAKLQRLGFSEEEASQGLIKLLEITYELYLDCSERMARLSDLRFGQRAAAVLRRVYQEYVSANRDDMLLILPHKSTEIDQSHHEAEKALFEAAERYCNAKWPEKLGRGKIAKGKLKLVKRPSAGSASGATAERVDQASQNVRPEGEAQEATSAQGEKESAEEGEPSQEVIIIHDIEKTE